MPVKDQLDRLAAFAPTPHPVVSLYLNTQPGQTGRDQFQTFVRKEFAGRSETYPSGSPERASLAADLEKIRALLDTGVDPAANGVAVFACSAADLFEVVQLTAPIHEHWLSIDDHPHLYPLVRVHSLFPRYAALLADTNSARILVIAAGEVVTQQEVTGVKTRRSSQGGWAQARFQRHIENFHVQHAKEVVDALDRIAGRENITEIVIAGDEVIVPLLRDQMPKHLAEKIVDHLKIDTNAPLDAVITTSLEAMRRVRGQTEREKVEAAVGAFRAGGLGTVGVDRTLDALEKGQVDELLIGARINELQPVGAHAGHERSSPREGAVTPVAAGEAAAVAPGGVALADELITRATQTGAAITVVEDPDLLAAYGGVAAVLRFKI